MSISVTITKNLFPALAAELPGRVNRALREQVLASESDTKQYVVAMDVIDTGNLLNSVRGEMTGQYEGLLSVSAESAQGYPYPWIQNFGGTFISPRPFFSQAVTKAEGDFARRMRDVVEP